MTTWLKVENAPYYLEIWEGPYRSSYRVNFRADGLSVRKKLEGKFKTWRDALKAADLAIAEARVGRGDIPRSQVRTEDLCNEVVALKRAKDPATYSQAELFFRLHLKPFLNQHCPYAADLNATVWLKYKTHLRLKTPTVALFNHWKFFGQLCKYAFEKGVITQKPKLEYSEKREDFRARGLIIPDEDFAKILEAANRVWRDRILIQWLTGMRPGEVRELRKDRYDAEARTINLRKEDTKTRQARSFVVPEAVSRILEARIPRPGPYFFPNERDAEKPMDKHLNGWRAALRGAGVTAKYTPHDLRHSYLTKLFKTPENPALICYQAGLSLEEAQKTYLHFTADDTQSIAERREGLARDS